MGRAQTGTTRRRRGRSEHVRRAGTNSKDTEFSDSKGISRVSNPWFCVCAFHASPPWLRENKFILDGYRFPVRSKRYALASIFRMHNETVNIWTHLVGFIMFLALTISFAVYFGAVKAPMLPPSFNTLLDKMDGRVLREVLDKPIPGLGRPVGEMLLNSTGLQAIRNRLHSLEHTLEAGVAEATHQGMERIVTPLKDRLLEVSAIAEMLMHDYDVTHKIAEYVKEHLQTDALAARWPFYVFLSGAMICLLFSTLCHTFHCISPEFSSLIWRFDYAGIVCLISTSYFPVVFYSFQCLPAWRTFYLSTICVLATVCILVSCLETFQHIKYQPLRAAMFSGLGLVGIVPIMHQLLFTWRELPPPILRMALLYEFPMAACYLTGVMCFVVRVPERWFPGKFDIWFQSHNIFHVLVVAGALFHYGASMLLLQWRDHQSCAVDGHMLQSYYLE